MNYSVGLTRILRRLDHHRISREKADQSDPLSWSYFRFLAAISRNYLLWSGGYLCVQILEVLALATYHFIYLPPESMTILRLTTSLHLSALVLTLAKNFSWRNEETVSTGKRQIAQRLAYGLLSFGLSSCLTIAVALYFLSNLNYSTPPIYRAVLIAGLMTLPLNLFSTFCIFNKRALEISLVSLPNRFILFSFNLLSIVAIIRDQPLGYLLARLLPEVYLFTAILRLAGPIHLPFLHEKRFASQSLLGTLGVFTRKIVQPFGPIIVSEINSLVLYYALSKKDPRFGLLIFMLHKLMHLTQIMSFKHLLRIGGRIYKSALIQDLATKRALLGKYEIGVGYFSLLSLLFAPLLYVKHQSVRWSSPTGEILELGHYSAALLMLLLLARSLLIIPISLSFLRLVPAYTISVLLLSNAGVAYLFIHSTLSSYSFQTITSIVVAIDIVSCSALYLWSKNNFSRQVAVQTTPLLNSGIFTFLRGNNQPRLMLIIKLWSKKVRRHLELGPAAAHFSTQLTIGRSGLILISDIPDKSGRIIRDLLCSLGSECRQIHPITITENNSSDILIQSVKLKGILSVFEAYTLRGKGESQARSISEPRSGSILSALTSIASARDERQIPGITSFIRDPISGWNLTNCPPRLRSVVQNYLVAIKDDPLNPAVSLQKEFRGIIHLNKRGATELILCLDKSIRVETQSFRVAAFIYNFVDMAFKDENKSVLECCQALLVAD